MPRVPVMPPETIVCHCFGHTRGEVEAQALALGWSPILERIREERRRGGCQCAMRNPSGR